LVISSSARSTRSLCNASGSGLGGMSFARASAPPLRFSAPRGCFEHRQACGSLSQAPRLGAAVLARNRPRPASITEICLGLRSRLLAAADLPRQAAAATRRVP
jgi:hypothetical protein